MFERSTKRLNLIQVYRGIAAVLVLLAHMDLIFNQNLNQNYLAKIFTFGGSGVDFFFVLSGFVIFYVHKSDIGKQQNVKSFLIKRFLRVYPIYWIVLTAKLSTSWFLSSADRNERNLIEVLKAYLLFPQNREILSSSFLGVSWTLTHEVFFYLMFAILIGLQIRLATVIIVGWLTISALNFLNLIALPDNLVLQFIFSPFNLEFLFGSLAAYVACRNSIKISGSVFIFIGTFFYTLAAINYYYQITDVPAVIAFGIPSTLLVFGAASLEMKKTINIPYSLIFVGNASYSIYLMHGFFINNLTKIMARLSPETVQSPLLLGIAGTIIAAIALCLGCAFFFYVEKPLVSTLKPRMATT